MTWIITPLLLLKHALKKELVLMKPEEGARKQVEIYKGMSGKERLKIAFEMWEVAFAQVKASEKSLNPNLSEKEVERRARQRMTDGAIRGS
ncbi:MAG: hypothetical protein JSU78_05730 [Deltaproteobacteria bacterium]|nr:MAG: hypothetical protein JSU78_05730 [Deltaproteobacteria bacterium]